MEYTTEKIMVEEIRWIGTTIFVLTGIFGFWLLFKLLGRGKY